MRNSLLKSDKSITPILLTILCAFILILTPAAPLVAQSSSTSKKPATSKPDDKKSDDKPKSPDDENEEPASSSSPEPEPAVTPENLPGRIRSILSGVEKNSRWGVRVELIENGQVLFESKSDETFIPASNRKLFTGALAFDQLGPNYVFRTYLYHTGTIDAQGNLNGNLVIIPTGDPSFSKTLFKDGTASDWVFRDWADKVKAAGIKRINGELLIDCSSWDMSDITPKGWPARVLNDSYAPQTSPLTINNNITNIVLNAGKSGQAASVSFIPPATGYPVVNNTKSGQKGTPSARRVVNSHIEVRGGLLNKYTIWSIPIDKPTLYAAANFRHYLGRQNIDIQKGIRIHTASGALPAPTPQNTIAVVESPTVKEIVDYMMKRSDNHMAEQLYVAISHAKLGKGSYGNTNRLEAEFLARAGINTRGMSVGDGSGLSESNRVSPTDICKLLTYMKSHRYANEYYDSMSINGRDGTLRNRMKHMTGRVHAKTGTINGVVTLSGYLALGTNKTVAFSFLVNDIKGVSVRSVQDRICSAIAKLVI